MPEMSVMDTGFSEMMYHVYMQDTSLTINQGSHLMPDAVAVHWRHCTHIGLPGGTRTQTMQSRVTHAHESNALLHLSPYLARIM